MKIKDYVKVQSLEEAYKLNQKKSNRIIGGNLWLRMSKNQIQTAIDLSELGLDQIEETESEFKIGCMVTLRQLEMHPGLNAMTQGAVRDAVRDIVGVQFRNLATVGGSIFGRFGFSDVLTCFLSLNTEVELYHGGIVSLDEFSKMKRDNDILVRLIVKKEKISVVYLSKRNSKTDFPVLACAVSLSDCGKVAIGARPGRAVLSYLTKEEMEQFGGADAGVCQKIADRISSELEFSSNMRAGEEYRRHLASVLTRRALLLALERRTDACR